MPPETAKYLRDMLDSVQGIEEVTKGHDLDTYLASRPTRDATNWNFCVIGEALSQLRKIDEPTAARISDHRKITGLRNQLIHGYGVIDHQITWSIIAEKLPTLRRELEMLLAE